MQMNEKVRQALSNRLRRRVLEELIKKKRGTAYTIAKCLNVPEASVSNHLDVLKTAGLVKGPNIDTSEGRLKKIYQTSDKAEQLLKEFWIEEIKAAPNSIQKLYRR